MSTNIRIQKLYKQALDFQAHKPERALQTYNEILIIKPDIPEVHFQVGRIFFKENQFEKAIKHLTIASKLKPNEFLIWTELCTSLLCHLDPEKIKTTLKRLNKSNLPKKMIHSLQRKLKNKATHIKVPIGNIDKIKILNLQKLINEKQLDIAYIQANLLRDEFPNNAAIVEILARIQLQLKKPKQARENFENALQLNPNFSDALKNFSQFEAKQGNYDQALVYLKRAIQITPRNLDIITAISQIFIQKNRWSDAITLLQNAKKIAPKQAQFDYELGDLYQRRAQHDQAIHYFKIAITKGMNTAQIYLSLGISQVANNTHDLAVQSYETAIKKNEQYPAIYYRQALLFQENGEFSKALENIKKAIKLDPENALFFRAYVSIEKIEKDDPIITQMLSFYDTLNSPNNQKAELGFAIVKALEDTKEYETAFKYLSSANETVEALFPYNIKEYETEISKLKEDFSDFDLKKLHGQGYQAAKPIFICGLPRSGTTLVEQIISSHSRVTGAGEVGSVRQAELKLLNKDIEPRNYKDLSPSEIKNYGKEISDYLQSLYPEADIISDKSILTYKRMGLLKAALPNCKIIVVRRDPRDNLLSIYRNKFIDGSHGYAYNLQNLGRYYKQFDQLITFWREKMAEEFYEIHYENLIHKPEEETRKLIDFCGLNWEGSCLNFYNSKRRVKTLSISQVRQPIYKSSLKAWKKYETHLQPLFEALK